MANANIARVEANIISVPAEGNAFADGNEETVLVRVFDGDGLYGIGECVATPAVTKAMIEMDTIHFWSQGISNIVVGKDPLERVALYDQVYHGSFYHGRRGILIHALSAVDMAIHDLAAKQIGQPLYKLLGGARQDRIVPYATIYPGDIYDQSVSIVIRELERQARVAMDSGLRALKVPVLFGRHLSDRALYEFIRGCRAMVGAEIELALDFGYRWHDWHDAARLLKSIDEFSIYFAEAPLEHDNLQGHARLVAASPIRIGGAEFATTRYEVREWLETAHISLVQPGISRAGGFTDLLRIGELCELYGAILIPHSYATGITDYANFHLMAASRTVPMVEFRASSLGASRLRRELVYPAEPTIANGVVALPTAPGLGVDLNEELVQRYTLR